MPKSKSDYVAGSAQSYASGIGFYTTHSDVSDMLQIGAFGASGQSTPDIPMVGKIIKRMEAKVDDKIKGSYRPEIIDREMHSFISWNQGAYPVAPFKDYVGFIQLDSERIRKIIALEIYDGNDNYKDIAGAVATYTPPTSAQNGTYTLTLTVGDVGTGFRFVMSKNNATNGFYDYFGQKTTVKQICSAINEEFPHSTARFTNETSAKSIVDQQNNGSIVRGSSDFFYAMPDDEGTSVKIYSLLPSDAGTICTLEETLGSTTTTTNFSDKESGGRSDGDFWKIDKEGKIFFKNDWPYISNHSVRVTYIRGEKRVPASIHEATTKLVAAEILLHDDNTILIAETGSNIDLAAKREALVQEADAILKGKSRLLHLID